MPGSFFRAINKYMFYVIEHSFQISVILNDVCVL